MSRIMDAAAVAHIRQEMDKAGTAKSARKRMAELAINRPNVTPCGRAEWLKELDA